MNISKNILTMLSDALALTMLLISCSLAFGQQASDWSDSRRRIVINRPFNDVLKAIATYHGYNNASEMESVANSWLQSFNLKINAKQPGEISTSSDLATFNYRFAFPNGIRRAPTEIFFMRIWRRSNKEDTFDNTLFRGTPIQMLASKLDEILKPSQAAAEEIDRKLSEDISKIKGKPYPPTGGFASNCDNFDLVEFLRPSEPTARKASLELYQKGAMANANTFLSLFKTNPSYAVQNRELPSNAGYMSLIGCSKQDFEEAKFWNEIAVSLGSHSASHNLAWMYQNGISFAKDEVKAATLYRTILIADSVSPAAKRAARENLALLSPEAVAIAAASEQHASSPPPPTEAPTGVANAAVVAAPKPAAEPTPTTAPVVAPIAAPAAASTATLTTTGTGKRRALVMGNDTYRLIPKLVNAREDAKALSESLKNVGYQVTLKLDLTEKEMKAALRTFAAQIEGGDEVVVFFAGHGVQIGSANFLLPVDIAGDSEAQVKDEAIQLQRILDDMTERKTRFTLAIIDACRDNPFKSSGRSIGGRGLGATTAATGQMVIFSAGAGQQALDKLGPGDKNRNGLFTRIFLKEMQKPGVSVDKVVRNVRAEVVELAKSVGHDQVPAIYDQVVGEYYFKN